MRPFFNFCDLCAGFSNSGSFSLQIRRFSWSPGMPGCRTGNSNTFVTLSDQTRRKIGGCFQWQCLFWEPGPTCYYVISFLKADNIKGWDGPWDFVCSCVYFCLTCKGNVFFANVAGTFLMLLVVTCALFPKVQLPLSDETEFMFKVIETTLNIS